MPMKAEEIEAMIRAALPDARIEITDLAGDENHYSARVVSEAFRGLSRLQRTRRVYDALGEHMGGTLHALQLTTAVPD